MEARPQKVLVFKEGVMFLVQGDMCEGHSSSTIFNAVCTASVKLSGRRNGS